MEFEAQGIGGSLILSDDKITIKRRGFNAFILGLKGDKEIFLSSITSIQLKKHSIWSRGFIQIIFPGSPEIQGTTTYDAVQNENCLIFTKAQEENFLKIKNMIEEEIKHSKNTTPSVSTASEIEKLLNLKKEGALTEEEFQKLKSKLL